MSFERAPASWRLSSHAMVLAAMAFALTGCSPVLPSGTLPATAVAGTARIAPSPSVPASARSIQPAGSSGLTFKAVRLAMRLPEGRSRPAALVLGSDVLVCGGLTNAGGTTSSIVRINLETGRVALTGALAVAVHDAGAAGLGDAGFVFGGGRTVAGRSVQRIDAAGRAMLVGELPVARADLAAVSVAGEILIVGGGTPGQPDARVLATTDGIHFRELARLGVAVRYPAVAVLDGIVYVAGGSTRSGETDAIQTIDPATGAVRVVGRLPHPIADATALVVGGQLLVVGGRDRGRALDELWAVGSGGGSARAVGHLPYAVADAAGVVIGGAGYLIGGETTTAIASIIAISAP